MEDILFSVPTWDDDNKTYYIEHVWACQKKSRCTYTICDPDGNHEYISTRDVDMLMRQSDGLWLEYAYFARRTGEDPLANYTRGYDGERTIKRRVTLRVHQTGKVLRLLNVRWSNGSVSLPGMLPKGMKGWLCLSRNNVIKGVTLQDLGKKPSCRSFRDLAEWKEAVPEEKLQALVRRRAGRNIRALTKAKGGTK